MNEHEIPYYLTDDDDTEEMEPYEYRPIPPRSEWEFPDPDLLPDPATDVMEERQKMAVLTGFEPATSGVTGRHSNHLNYNTKKEKDREETPRPSVCS